MVIIKKNILTFIAFISILFILILGIISFLIINTYDISSSESRKFFSEIIIYISILLSIIVFLFFFFINLRSIKVLKELDKIISITKYGKSDIGKNLDKINPLGEKINQLFSQLFLYSEKKSLVISSLSNIINFVLNNINLNIFIIDVEGLIIKNSKCFCKEYKVNPIQVIYQNVVFKNFELKEIIFMLEQDLEPLFYKKIIFTIYNKKYNSDIIFYPVTNIKNKISNIICITDKSESKLKSILKNIKAEKKAST